MSAYRLRSLTTCIERGPGLDLFLNREIPRIIDVYKRWGALHERPPSLPPFSEEANELYMREILAEKPPIRLWAEEATYRVRKRQGRSGALDQLLETHLARKA
jgi:hypothetical protein